MTATYPAGYGTRRDTMDQVRSRHQARYHPEAWRRIEAAMVASEGILGLPDDEGMCGIGGGARTREEQEAAYARDPNTFAPPDRSFHQVWTWKSGKTGAQAVDWVGSYGRHSEAWKWLRDNGGRFGLKTFWNVNGEPWHSQCSELPNSVSSWLKLGKPDPSTWDLGTPPPPAEPDYGLWPLNPTKPAIREGSLGDAVTYAQKVLRNKASQDIAVDGDFGPQTFQAVRNLQIYFGTKGTPGVIDKDEWDILDALVGVHHTPPAPPETPDGPQIVLEGLYWVQQGDNAWNTEKTVYGGTGSKWKDHFTAEQFNKYDYHIPLPDLPGVTAEILPGEGPYAAIKRMYPAENPYAPGRLERFYDLNGGSGRTLQPGDVVFLDEPA